MGGNGTVYLAQVDGTSERVAVKLYDNFETREPGVAKRRMHEAHAASNLQHENIVRVHESGAEHGGSAYLVMEYLEGEDLAVTIDREGSLPWPRAKSVVLQILAALQCAHRAGILHRDIKLENCFRETLDGGREVIKVLDFGSAESLVENAQKSAAAPSTGQDPRGGQPAHVDSPAGTAAYISPEQARGRPLDQRADLYAVGVVLFELLTGELPFDAPTFAGIIHKQVHDPPPSPRQVAPDNGITPQIEALVLRLLAKSPEDRFPDCRSAAQAVRSIHDYEPAPRDDRRSHGLRKGSHAQMRTRNDTFPQVLTIEEETPAASTSSQASIRPTATEAAQPVPPSAASTRTATDTAPALDKQPAGNDVQPQTAETERFVPPPVSASLETKDEPATPTDSTAPSPQPPRSANAQRREARATLIFSPSLPSADALPGLPSPSPVAPEVAEGVAAPATAEPSAREHSRSSRTDQLRARLGLSRAAASPASPATQDGGIEHDQHDDHDDHDDHDERLPSRVAARDTEPTNPTPTASVAPQTEAPGTDRPPNRNSMAVAGSFDIDTMPESVARELLEPLRARRSSGEPATADGRAQGDTWSNEAADTQAGEDDALPTWAETSRRNWRPIAALAASMAVAGVAALMWVGGEEDVALKGTAGERVAASRLSSQRNFAEEVAAVVPTHTAPVPSATLGGGTPSRGSTDRVLPSTDDRATGAPGTGQARQPGGPFPTEATAGGGVFPAGSPATAPPDAAGSPRLADGREKRGQRAASARPTKASRKKKGRGQQHQERGSATSGDQRAFKMPRRAVQAAKACGRKHGGLPGDRVATTIVIKANGRVASADTAGRRVSQDLARCIDAAVSRTKFPGQSGEHRHYFTL